MKITKFILLIVFAMFLFACENNPNLSPDSFDGSTSSLKSGSLTEAALNRSFIVIASGDNFDKSLEKAIAAVNGSVLKTIPEIGLGLVSSSDPDFALNAAGIKGVDAVVPNLKSEYIDPEMRRESVEIEEENELLPNGKIKKGKPDASNPPVSGDDDFFFDLQWGLDAIDAPEAWEAGYRGEGVRVGILDTGFDLDHPDLAPNINMQLSMDMTGQGLQYTLPDAFSHGTHTAGIVAAAENGYGTIGVAPEAELVLIKVLLDEGYGYLFDILNGIIYATLVDVDVINMSIGATIEKSGNAEDGYTAADAAWYKNIYSKAIAYAYQNGTTVIASAGNESTDYDHTADLIHMPSGAPHAICISATAPIGWAVDPATNLDVFASTYSNYGQSTIDFAAPGGNYAYFFVDGGASYCTVAGLERPCYVFDYVFSTGNGGWYWSVGTSMAAPHAVGVAALIIGENGGSMLPEDVKAALEASADDLGKPGNDDYYGLGRVNAMKAIMN
jgi:subtilisin family serine protease